TTRAAIALARPPDGKRSRVGEKARLFAGQERGERTQLLERSLTGQFQGRIVAGFDQNAAPLPEPSEEHEPAAIGSGRHFAAEKGNARLRLGVDQMPRAAAQKIERLRILERHPRPVRVLPLLGATIDVRT